MSKTRNCPNCGAVIDVDNNKCAYCGTSYYDLSVIPFNEPFFLRLNIGTQDKPYIILQKVYLSNASIEYSNDSVYVRGGVGNITSFPILPTVSYDMHFVGLGDYKEKI